MHYTFPFVGLETHAVQDSAQTVLALITADTLGHRLRLRRLNIGFADATPQDRDTDFLIKRIDNLSGGSVGVPLVSVPGADMGRADSQQIASWIGGTRGLYSTEPNVYGDEEIFAQGLNHRGGIVMEWEKDDAPVLQRDGLLGLLAIPRTGNAAIVTGTFGFELF